VIETEFPGLSTIQKCWVLEIVAHRYVKAPVWINTIRDDYDDLYEEGVSIGDYFGE
jgi:hypothetical protein